MRSLARIERFQAINLDGLATAERAVLPCGCSIFVGVRKDNGEAATAARPCCEPHTAITERANDLLRESTARPQHVLLVKVCADLLTRAAHEIRPWTATEEANRYER